jgi:hypothetical protein
MLIKDATATPIDYLRMAVGRDDARFRDEQLECIEAAVRGERLLVVQRTGWGKSIVYFIATRLLRDRGAGPTLIVSPLLSLMRNQLAAAARIGLRSATINSANTARGGEGRTFVLWLDHAREIKNLATDGAYIRGFNSRITTCPPHRTAVHMRRSGSGGGVFGRSLR